MKAGGYVVNALALADQLRSLGPLLHGELRLPSELHTPLPGRDYAGAGAFPQVAALQFGKDGDDLPHGAACRRFQIEVLGKRAKLHAALAEVVEYADKIPQVSPHPVELPRDDNVASLQFLEA